MASFLASLKKDLLDESELSEKSQDSFYKKDFDKLRGMIADIKEVTLWLV